MQAPLRWLFLDMDNYFASVEQQDRPELRGRPVGVIPCESEGTCCIAASKEAKRHGVKTGTGVREAKHRCPGIKLVVARPRRYVVVHQAICAAIQNVIPIDKVWSIDEMAVRLMGRECEVGAALEIGRRVKQAVCPGVGEVLSCSVGLASSRLMAKVASELGKPDGLTALTPDDLPGRIAHLSLIDLPGINVGIRARLHKHNILTVEDLWAMTAQQAQEAWGSVEGRRYWMGLHGEDPKVHVEHRRTITHANVLAPALRTPAGAHAVMTRLLHKAGRRLRAQGYFARTLSVSVKDESGTRWHDGINLPTCQDTITIIEHFERLWKRRPTHAIPKPKKVGITAGGLIPTSSTPGLLFDEPKQRRDLDHAIDTINRRFGGHKVYMGGMHMVAKLDMPDKIAFGRIPNGHEGLPDDTERKQRPALGERGPRE
ncbi:MAG: Y-family DNA polymerase [Phycisphaerales bacterium JB063]